MFPYLSSARPTRRNGGELGQPVMRIAKRFELGTARSGRCEESPMMKPTVIVPEDQPFTLANSSPGRAQKRLALAVVLALGTLLILTGEFSNIQLKRIDAFVAAYGMAVFVNDLIINEVSGVGEFHPHALAETDVRLSPHPAPIVRPRPCQFAILRSRALLAISNGYLFAALIVIPLTLAFPGVFAPNGLLGAGLQSTAWFQMLRFAGFPAFVIAYALLKDADPSKRLGEDSVGATILLSVAMTSAVVCVAIVLVTVGDAYSPRFSIDPVHFSPLFLYGVAGCLILWNAVALILLWMRQRSVLDLWLMVVVYVYVIEICLGLVCRSGPVQRRLVCQPSGWVRVQHRCIICPVA